MKYAGIIYNDFAAAPGVCLSFFVQGCRRHCPGCFNSETWDFDGGYEFTQDTLNKLIHAITANGIHRTLCILGGEPMCAENMFLTDIVITEVLKEYPNQEIWIWTGYTLDELIKRNDSRTNDILSKITGIVDGPFIQEQRDITLNMRGSKNQRIIQLKNTNTKLPEETIQYEQIDFKTIN